MDDLSGKSKPELADQLIQLAASLKEEDLKDPATYGLVAQLLTILDPQADPLPKELVERLQNIPDKKARFMEAALSMGANGIEQLERLIESMKSAGLMKAEDVDGLLSGAAEADLNLEKGINGDWKSDKKYRFKHMEFSGDRGQSIRLYHGKKRIGHLAFSSRPDKDGYHSVYNSAIDQEHRGKGLYQEMIRLAGEHAIKRGSKGVKSPGYQRSKDADRVWDKVATHADPFTPNAKVKNKLSPGDSDYFYTPDLTKGAMRRLAPFNPDSVPKEQRMHAAKWMRGDGKFHRNKLEELDGAAKERALHRLSSATKVRKNPVTGEREFLLHRGPGPIEAAAYRDHGAFTEMTSWTPKISTATGFAHDHYTGRDDFETQEHWKTTGKTPVKSAVRVSAWIPESQIHHSPKMIGDRSLPMLSANGREQESAVDRFSSEHEVIVKPHKLRDLKYEENPNYPTPEPNVDHMISLHGQGIKPNWKHPSITQYRDRLRQKMEKSELKKTPRDYIKKERKSKRKKRFSLNHIETNPKDPIFNPASAPKPPTDEYRAKATKYLESQNIEIPPQANEPVYPSGIKMKKSGDPMADHTNSTNFDAVIQKVESLKKSLSEAKSEAFSPLFSDMTRSGSEHTCPQNWKESISQQLDEEIIRKLGHLEKADSKEPSAGTVDFKIMANLTKPATGEKRKTKLLTPETANAKTKKNSTVDGYHTAILHLAPAGLAGRGNVCPDMSAGCSEACLNTAGRGGMVSEEKPLNTIHQARVNKTQHLVDHPHKFLEQLDSEITAHKKKAAKLGKKPVVRLNGTSDLAWENYKHPAWEGKNIIERHSDVQFYDYTKRAGRVRNNKHQNYHLTFSQSEKNHAEAKQLLSEGHNVAAVFGGKALPKEHNGHKVISGDDHDLRFTDPRGTKETGGHYVGLKAKGDAKYDDSGFTIWGHSGDPEAKPKTREKGQKSKRSVIQGGLVAARKKNKGDKLAASESAREDMLKRSEDSPTLGKSYRQLNPQPRKTTVSSLRERMASEQGAPAQAGVVPNVKQDFATGAKTILPPKANTPVAPKAPRAPKAPDKK